MFQVGDLVETIDAGEVWFGTEETYHQSGQEQFVPAKSTGIVTRVDVEAGDYDVTFFLWGLAPCFPLPKPGNTAYFRVVQSANKEVDIS